MAKKGKYAAYLRVSTQQQGRSGLGLEAQRKAVADHLGSNGRDLIAEFVETESGKRNGRPELDKALSFCRQRNATLVVAKLDRLTRNTRFLLTIVEQDVQCVFCDLPQMPPGPMGKFFLTLMAAVAELEAGMISQRTKAALAAAKARGVKLGSPAQERGSAVGVAVRKAKAEQHVQAVLPIIRDIQQAGVTSLAGIARALGARGVPTARGGAWHANSVHRVIKRARR